MREGDWILTYTGRQFWPIDPRPEELCIEDIAHSLSLQCRFTGHVKQFYSVAEHSWRVSYDVPVQFALWGLLHDASEAYLTDLSRPVKRHSAIGTAYMEVELRLQKVIAEHFGMQWPMPDEVHVSDDVLLMTEKRDLMPCHPAKWRETATPQIEQIVPFTSDYAEDMFLERFYALVQSSPSSGTLEVRDWGKA